MTSSRSRLLGALAGTALFVAACGGGDSSDGQSSATDAPSTDAPSTDAPSTDAPSTEPAGTEADPGDADAEPVELEPAADFVFGNGDPVCAESVEDEVVGITYYEAPCAEPHNAELVALVAPPGDEIPADVDEATQLFNELCLPSVREATGLDLMRPGVSIGYFTPGAFGEAYDGDVQCYATFASTALVGSFQDVPADEILVGQHVVIADLAPGDCFLFAEDSFVSGTPASCDEPEALMFVGSYEAADRPYPGLDELRAERAEQCAQILIDSGLIESGAAGDPSTLSGTFPGEASWRVPGRRLVTCDIEPA